MKPLAAAIERAGTATRAKKEKAYLKSELVHYGVPVPGVRTIVKAYVRAHRDMTKKELRAGVEWLWSRGVYELRFAACELLIAFSPLLSAKDAVLIERFIREAKTWALVDVLAPSIMGPLFVREPSLGRVLDRWAKDDDFWVRRAALLTLLLPLRAGEGDFPRFSRYAAGMLDEKEFFIRKAIGWVLRETSKKRPELVRAWIEEFQPSGLTLREAAKKL
ncbi:MAG: DNA alkylation repair protein [Deltaproteobacteria bacterium]|nr:DNA alkylation repair protein [Deltaproteobacteria bacterium]